MKSLPKESIRATKYMAEPASPELMDVLRDMHRELVAIKADVTTLKIQGDRNEVSIKYLTDRVIDIEKDVKWLKRSQGWQEKVS